MSWVDTQGDIPVLAGECGLILSGLGHRGLFEPWHNPWNSSRVSRWDRPPTEVKQDYQDSFTDEQGIGPSSERDSVPARWNILKRVEDLSIVTDFTDEPLLATKTAAVHMRGGKFNDLAQEWSQLSLYYLQKEKQNREESKFIENKKSCRCRTGIPFLYTTGKPLIIISQQLWERKDIVFSLQKNSLA